LSRAKAKERGELKRSRSSPIRIESIQTRRRVLWRNSAAAARLAEGLGSGGASRGGTQVAAATRSKQISTVTRGSSSPIEGGFSGDNPVEADLIEDDDRLRKKTVASSGRRPMQETKQDAEKPARPDNGEASATDRLGREKTNPNPKNWLPIPC
jgi:hypothetical protein